MVRTNASEWLRQNLRGPVVAMTTPMHPDESIDTKGLQELTEFYNQSNIDWIAVGGSTGEFFSMTDEERRHIVETVVEASDDNTYVMAGCQHSGTQLTLDLVQHAEEIGVDAAMVQPPYYSFSGWDGIKRHFEIISDESDIGICVYFSGSNLRFSEISEFIKETRSCPERMKELADIPNVGAFKDSTGDYGFHKDVVEVLDGPDGEAAIMGSNGMEYHLWGYESGSRTFLTGLGNVWPSVEVEFFEALESGDRDRATEIVDNIERDYLHTTKFGDDLGPGKYWVAVKALQEMQGLPGGPVRSPLVGLTEDEKDSLQEMLERTGLNETEMTR
jgi:4-hydroxy-tetrahydrodipicolinate synthase